MICKNKQRNTAVLYTCGVCNLKCRYCGIDKNPILGEIDKALEESFKGNYYFNRIRDYFEKGQLVRIETWGGEPFLHMDRIYNLLDKLIQYYPYFSEMYSSTNFSYPTWIDQVFGLWERFRKYPYRNFTYTLQLSVDGPEYINDMGRGQGVTKRCLENFDKLCNRLVETPIPDNLKLEILLKGTLDNESIRKLNNKQAIIDYYNFYEENFIDKINKLKLNNVMIYPGVPNTAVPSPVTVEEGKIFANVVKLCREIEKENKTFRYFKYYNEITPFANNSCENCLTYRYGYHNCGTGSSLVGFLPNDMISICHEGFTEFVEDYKKYAAESNRVESGSITFNKFINEKALKLCVTDDGYAEHERKMSYFNRDNSSARLISTASLIRVLAMAGQIEEKYKTEEGALKAAIFIQSHTSFCIKDNINKTGTLSLVPIGLLKLLLNGAMDYIQNDGELKV